MPKERNFNPVQAQRKAEKAKAIKKGKTEVQSRRNEKLARRNPERIQKQIDDLKAVTTNGGKLSRHEEQVLEGLEKELRGVNKAREALGDHAPSFGGEGRGSRDGRGGGVLGKRRRDADRASSDEDVPEDVKSIPMPRDTPPPVPKEVMDAWWARRRARWQAERGEDANGNDNKRDAEWQRDKGDQGTTSSSAPAPTPEVKTVYESKPIVRDLHKEAVSAFVPSAVRTKMDKGRGQGGLMEPEEADRLEREGYLRKGAGQHGQEQQENQPTGPRPVMVEDVEDDAG